MKSWVQLSPKGQLIEELASKGWPRSMLNAMSEAELAKLKADAPPPPPTQAEVPLEVKIQKGLGLSPAEYEAGKAANFEHWEEVQDGEV